MKQVVTVPEDVARISRTYLPINDAIFFFMDDFVQAPLILLKVQDQISLTLCWRSVDDHFQDVVGRVSIRVLHSKAANMPKMNRDIPMSIFYN
jgi:hypothetical protein